MPGSAPAKPIALSSGQISALARAIVRELGWGLRAVLREVERWRLLAAQIPDATIRGDALAALTEKRPNTDGAALFWTVATRRNPRLLRLLVAYEIMADFLDSLVERGAYAGVQNGRQLHLALVDAVDVGRPLSGYYRHHPWKEDGGYLSALVRSCRYGCVGLPEYRSVRPLLIRAASLAQVQGINHELDLPLREALLEEWARLHFERQDAEIDWYETAGAASAWLTVLALMAAAADTRRGAQYAPSVYAAYFPWFSLTATLLDSYGDLLEDRANKANSYIAYYGSLEEAVKRIDEVVRRAGEELRLLENSARHSVLLGAMVAMYLTKDSAISAEMRAMSDRLLHAAGPLAVALGPLLRGWRVAAGLGGM